MITPLFRFLNDTIKSPLLDACIPAFSDKDYVVIPGIAAVCIVLYLGRRHARTCMVALLLALLLSDLGSEKGIKNLVRARRPYAVLEDVHLYRNDAWVDYHPAWYPFDSRKSYAFPSTHSANAAALVVVLFMLHRRTLWATAPLAALVGFSRIYTGNHFPLQVLGGYLWGFICGAFALAICFLGARCLIGPPPDPLPPREPLARERHWFHWILAAWTLGNFAFIHLGIFDLAGDEAQYWDWARQPALGYYSKPPMIAYLMHTLVGAGGNKEWALRSGAVLLTSGAIALVYALTLRIARSERAALVAGLAALAMPLSWAGSVLMTIDPLLVFFWALALYAFHRAVNGDRWMWYVTGLALGLGILSKYTMAILYIPFALYLLAADRRWWAKPEPYLALVLSLLCLSGVLFWNATHGWISFLHTAAIGAPERLSVAGALGQEATYFGAQMLVVSPLLFAFFIWGGWHCLRQAITERDALFVTLGFGVLFGFYAVVSFARNPHPNWPVASYLAACIALGWTWVQRPRGPWGRALLGAAIVMGCLLGLLPRCTGLVYALAPAPPPGAREDRLHLAGLEIDPDKDPTNELRGGRELGDALEKYLDGGPVEPFLFSHRYQLTALMAFYAPGRPRTYCLNFMRRMNQYDLWGGWEDLKGRDALFVRGGTEEQAREAVGLMIGAGLFRDGEFLETVKVRRGPVIIKTYTISHLYSYSGQKMTPSEAWY